MVPRGTGPAFLAEAVRGWTVRQVAERTGMADDTVRYYARIGLLDPQRDAGNGYRRFDAGDVQRLIFIGRAKQLGFTLAEIRKVLDHGRQGDSPCPLVRGILRRRIDENRRRLGEMLRLQETLEEAMVQWETMPDGVPDGDRICHLIESIALPGGVQPEPRRTMEIQLIQENRSHG